MLKNFSLAIAIAAAVSVNAHAQTAAPTDPFDLAGPTAMAKSAGGIPTLASVDALGKAAYELFDAGNCEAALSQLETYARQTNLLANIIASGLEPFYDASFDDRKGFNTGYLVPFERTTNEYKRRRNEAMVMQAECLQKAGHTEQAVAHYVRALKIIDIQHSLTWERARKGLYEIVGVQ